MITRNYENASVTCRAGMRVFNNTVVSSIAGIYLHNSFRNTVFNNTVIESMTGTLNNFVTTKDC